MRRYSDVPMESLDKLSSQKLLALWMEFEQHAERETRLGLLQKLSIMLPVQPQCAQTVSLVLRNRSFPICRASSMFVKRRELES